MNLTNISIAFADLSSHEACPRTRARLSARRMRLLPSVRTGERLFVIITAYLTAYSQAHQIDQTLYLSGSIGLLPESGTMIEGGAKEQTHQALKNLGAVLKAANASYNNGQCWLLLCLMSCVGFSREDDCLSFQL